MSTREQVLSSLERVLGGGVSPRDDTPLSSFGVEAAVWAPLAAALSDACDVRITDGDVADLCTFGDLVRCVDRLRADQS